MEFLLSAIPWIFDPANWAPGSQSPLPIGDRIAEHLAYSGVSLAIALAIGLPLGFAIGHTGRGRRFVIGFTGAMRALPTLGVLFFLTMVLRYGLTTTPAVLIGSIIAFVILAVPSVLAGAYAGVESVEPDVVDAARAVGMTEAQILFRVEIPLGLPVIFGGLRSAALQIIATATIASYVGLGGLGRIISSGIGLNDYDVILGGALLVTALALVVDALFALLQRLTRAAGTQPPTRSTRRLRRPRLDAVTVSTAPERIPA